MVGHACDLVNRMLKIRKAGEVGVSPCFSTMGVLSFDEVVLDSHSLPPPFASIPWHLLVLRISLHALEQLARKWSKYSIRGDKQRRWEYVRSTTAVAGVVRPAVMASSMNPIGALCKVDTLGFRMVSRTPGPRRQVPHFGAVCLASSG